MSVLRMSLHTFRDRWTLFVGGLLSVALGVALVQAAMVVILAANDSTVPPGTSPADAAALRQAFSDVNALMGMSLFLGLFLSVFIISSTCAFTVNERRRELALLRLSGASRVQLVGLLLGEGVVLGMLGSALGAVLGLGATRAQLEIMRRMDLPVGAFDLHVPAWMLGVDGAIGVGIAVCGVAVAARRAAAVRPLDALRDVGEGARVMTIGRWLWGLSMGVPAVAAGVAAQASRDFLTALLLGFCVIFTGSIALQQLSPLVVPLVGRVVGRFARGQVLGDLAQAGMRHGVRRTATTAGPLIVLIGLVVGLLGILTSQTAATEVERGQRTRADLVVSTTGDRVDDVRRTTGVAVASPETQVGGRVLLPRSNRAPVPVERPVVTAVDPSAYIALLDAEPSSGILDRLGPTTALVGQDLGESMNRKQASLIVRIGGHSQRLSIAARMRPTLGESPDVVVPQNAVPATVLAGSPTQVHVRVAPGAAPQDVRDRLVSHGFRDTSTVRDWAAAQAAREGDEDVKIMGALAGLGGLYALISVVNAVAVGTAQRRREFAVARLTGLSRRQVVQVAAAESGLVATVGIALGGVVAAVCLLGVRRGNDVLLGRPVLDVPWLVTLGIVAVGLVACTGTAALAAWSATRERPVRLAAARE